MTTFRHETELERAFAALEADLVQDGGPQISTVRNYNFAILPYDPADEFTLRRKLDALCQKLRDDSWNVGFIALNTLLLNRLRAEGPEFIEAMIQRERRLSGSADMWRGLRTLKERIVTLLEGPDGLARDVISYVEATLQKNAETGAPTAFFLARAGALYPFFRTSALLKHVAGHTQNAPVVLLYPGTVVSETGLSFMGVLPADRDYRPRIYR